MCAGTCTRGENHKTQMSLSNKKKGKNPQVFERTKSPRRGDCVYEADASKNRFKELDWAEAAPQRAAAAAELNGTAKEPNASAFRETTTGE